MECGSLSRRPNRGGAGILAASSLAFRSASRSRVEINVLNHLVFVPTPLNQYKLDSFRLKKLWTISFVP